jgi:PAS domain S-box-containing protein
MKSVFTKLAVSQLVVGLLGLTILYLIIDFRFCQRMNETYAIHGQVVAQSLAKAVEPALVSRDLTSVQSTLDAILASPDVEWACVTAPDGEVLAHTLVPRFPESISIAQLSSHKDGETITMPGTGKLVTVFTRPVLTGIVGEIHVAFSREKLASSIHSMEWRVLAGFAGVMLAVALGFALLAHRIIAPIRVLTDAAVFLGSRQRGTFQAVPVRSNDEIGILTTAFNSMGLEIRDHQESLEKRVHERTEELVRANKDLAVEVSERKRMETALVAANSTLGELFKASPISIVAYDRQGIVQSWNPAAERLFGWTEREVIGQRLPFVPQNRQAEFQERIRRVLHGGDDLAGESVCRLRKDGSQVELSISSAPLRDARGTTVGLISVITDITERRRVEEEVQKARAAAEAANRAKSEFLANMSHEIRTPMNGVIGMTELALDTELTLQQREYLSMVKFSGDALMIVINDILDFSKIEAGKLELNPIQFNMRETIEDTARSLALRAHQKGLELVTHIQPGIPELLVGDPDRLRQVLLNLLGNAIKFTDLGEVILRVESEPMKDGVCLHFSVQDTGIGIPQDSQKLIFEAFTQADNSTTRKYGGTGLGLTITSRLVDLMGGRIWVDSKPGEGSVFHFNAPFTAGLAAAMQTPQQDSVDLHNPPAHLLREARPALRILLAEDNRVNQVLARRLLEKKGHTVVTANNGLEALVFLETQSFDVALMDVQMPQMGGFEATLAVRETERTSKKHLPIIALTAHAMKGDEERCLAAGMDGYIAKPIRKMELFALLERVTRSQPVFASAGEES